MQPPFLHPDRLFSPETVQRDIARDLYEDVRDLPIISPHGHTDPAWFASNAPFDDAASLFLTPDHYVLRMLRSRGISYDDLAVPRLDGDPVAAPRDAWARFAANYHLLLGTPSRLWIDHSMAWAFGLTEPLSADNADHVFDLIGERLKDDDMRPLAILDKARVECIATTEFALDPLDNHADLSRRGLIGRIRTTYRPDDVCDPDSGQFVTNLTALGNLTGCDVTSWGGMLDAHRARRKAFRGSGATATDHGVPSATCVDLGDDQKQALLDRVLSGPATPQDAALFRAQMLTEMAGLSVEDGMVMQIHAGSRRTTDPEMLRLRGPNQGSDIPVPVDPVRGLEPLLHKYGSAPGFRLIFFCLDETIYARELAPMAGYWPALMIGPPWWFHDSPRGIARYLDQLVETAGFRNLAGFNDDTRALLSIPARHDVWRRGVCNFLGGLVAQHTLSKTDARHIATWLSADAAKEAYGL